MSEDREGMDSDRELKAGDAGAPREVEARPDARDAAVEPAAAEAGAPPSPEEIAALCKLAAERDEYLDLLKRARADFANYRKRVDEERERWGLIGQVDLLSRFLTAADQCRLAADNACEDTSADSLRDAVRLVWSEVENFLSSAGVTRIPTEGERFDPHRHQAVQVVETSNAPDGTIVAEAAPGYEIADRILRPAQVVVSRRPRQPAPEPDAEAGEPGA